MTVRFSLATQKCRLTHVTSLPLYLVCDRACTDIIPLQVRNAAAYMLADLCRFGHYHKHVAERLRATGGRAQPYQNPPSIISRQGLLAGALLCPLMLTKLAAMFTY